MSRVVNLAGFSALLDALVAAGHELIGPTVRDGAIVLDRIGGVTDLPRGVGDQQAPGRYRLRARDDEALFGYAAPSQGWKRELFPPEVPLVQIRRGPHGLAFQASVSPARKLALIGVRGCDLAAIAIHDRVLRDGAYADQDYAARRAGVFVLAVSCGSPAGSCFCASMGTGPDVHGEYDLAATEVLEGEHRFVIEIGTEAGHAVVARVTSRDATAADLAAAASVVEIARGRMGRALDTTGLRDAIMGQLEHPRWGEVAARCLGCASCTLVCPTCFCTSIADTTDLSGEVATRTRRWDSCFTAEFAFIHGGSVRPSLRARYRQWLSHKLATWHDQFGGSGCVGCGRCITWCPAGIDITEEVAALRAPAGRHDHG